MLISVIKSTTKKGYKSLFLQKLQNLLYVVSKVFLTQGDYVHKTM
ncbi:hypothetical protein KN1_25220 [Stygiolobus caldivivus]|uniref:Uncharacterized protein n=1 Tax=Stygiolobus caldivivus TaxID=2824673 RepID=A0A8D5U8X4_9CREN|nr:hypothetical protein KN1_25220 [Stygiolobus caldivivus]